MIAEEWGFESLFVILIYIVLYFIKFIKLYDGKKRLCYVLCLGLLVTKWQFYMLVNIGMVSAFCQLMGVPLPLLSSGGTSTLTMMMMVGLILSADLSKKKKKKKKARFC